ncbi:MAG: ABC transporter ATP-binding protein [Treponema sp.]|nr:ABC transporter ATP-binding protein [Treponema sp.]
MLCFRCENITLGYEQKIVATNISFSVDSGDYLCVVGENGAGKTTLIKMIVGLQKPLAGSMIRGKEFDARQIGYLPQQTNVQKDFPATVEEVVLSGCQSSMGLFPFYRAAERHKAAAVMRSLGVASFARRSYRELSGGQQQRVLLCRALCAAKDMMVLDEPVAGLDPAASDDLYGIVQTLNDNGMTIVMITHDIRAAVRYARHILYLGERPFFGTVTDFLQSAPGRRFAVTQEMEA